jgi:hypothetical protein
MRAFAAPSYRHLNPSEIGKLKQAVEDEIYDYGYFAHLYEIGDNVGTPTLEGTCPYIYQSSL